MNTIASLRLCRGHQQFARRKLFSPSLAARLVFWLALPVFILISLPLQASQESGVASISTEMIHYDSNGFQIDAFVAKPASAGKHPAVLVIHDSLGLTDSIEEIAKQFAAAGFVALAPDFTSRLGGKRSPEQMAQDVGRLSPNVTVGDARAALGYLLKDSDVDAAKISTVGFGWGGWRSFMLADSVPELYRAVIYCGATPAQSFDAVHAPILAQYAQFDFRTTGNALLTEKMMTDAGKRFTYVVYPQANRGFYVPGPQYNANAAKQAWTRTLEFLK